MKPEQMYQQLKEAAEKLEIEVLEHSFRGAGIAVRSGPCKVKGKDVFIMDKNLSLRKKIRILSECLCEMHHENLYLVPAVRDLFSEMIHDKDKNV
jgi:hypothetical protein